MDKTDQLDVVILNENPSDRETRNLLDDQDLPYPGTRN